MSLLGGTISGLRSGSRLDADFRRGAAGALVERDERRSMTIALLGVHGARGSLCSTETANASQRWPFSASP